jgi:DNA polymerase-3 subunit alpha
MIEIQNTVNYLWLDCETTGLDPIRNDIVQLACIPIIAGIQQKISFNEHCQPIDWNAIDQKALAVHGLTERQLKQFQQTDKMISNFISYAKSFKCKFIIAGFNVGFDKEFIAATFKKVGKEKEFFEIFVNDIRCTYKRAKKLKAQLPTANLKLATLCDHFKIPIVAHDALSDISATIKLDHILSEMLGEVEIHVTEIHELIDIKFPEPAQLHCHSMFSHTDSISSIQDWYDFCSKNNIPGFSTPDHGNATSLYDIVRMKDGVVGIPGVGLLIKNNNSHSHLNAWAVSLKGYKNLIKLASLGWKNRFDDSNVEFPLLSLEELDVYKEGLVFGLPGVNGPIKDLLISRQISQAKNLIKTLNEKLDIRLELASVDVHKYYDKDIGFTGYNIENGNIQKHINKFYLSIAKEFNIKCIPVSDSHFIDKSDKIIQDAICKNAFDDNRYFFESRHVTKAVEMYSILKGHLGDDLTESYFRDMIQNTHDIMNKASTIKIKPQYHLPNIDIPNSILTHTTDYGMQCYYFTMQKIKEHGRWNDSPEYRERFKKEIDVVMKNATLNFLPYFLMYEDICAFTRASGLMQGIARGSAGGSLLSYYLKIIHVDPVAANLPFERFLSHARIRAGSFPDIDLDIADRARPLVMRYLKEKYGLGFAQIATFNKMKTKNAIKDAMYALYGRNRNDPEIKLICDDISDSPQGVDELDFLYGYTDQEDIEHEGELSKKPLVANFFKQYPDVESMVKKLIGVIRGWSRHASAFVISTIDISSECVPTLIMSDKDLGDITVTQYNATMVEKSGLVKADILGIKTLAMVSECLKLIKNNHNKDFLAEINGVPEIYRLPDKDAGVFADLYKGDTDSSFQFNSDIIKASAREFNAKQRDDLSLMTALYRPGSMDAQQEFVRVGSTNKTLGKDGRFETMSATAKYVGIRNFNIEADYIHDDLKPYIEDTKGVIVYQEQVMAILVGICGYSLEETDIIRSAIAKKKHEVIMATFDRVRSATSIKGWTSEQADQLCNTIMAFSRYSFNRSHSWAYAELGYITLYLKHHYKLEWWTAVLNNEGDNDKIKKYISYLGSIVVAPSLRNPAEIFSINGLGIVAPVSAIKSIGPAVVKELLSKAPFTSLEDYVQRVNHSRVNIGAMSALIKARAADDLMVNPDLDYVERRKKFMETYISLRKGKTSFKPEMYNADNLRIFLDEREYNLSFNKSLLSVTGIKQILESKWAGLQPTKNTMIPYTMGNDEGKIIIIDGVETAERLFEKKHDKEVGLFMLFDGSSYRTGLSKRTGKRWDLVSIDMNDGYKGMEGSFWKMKKAFGWSKDTIIYVRGTLQKGWKTTVCLNINEMEKIN